MKKIELNSINKFVGTDIIFRYGSDLKCRVMMSMGPTYFLIHEKNMVAYIYEGKIHNNKTGIIIPASLYEL